MMSGVWGPGSGEPAGDGSPAGRCTTGELRRPAGIITKLARIVAWLYVIGGAASCAVGIALAPWGLLLLFPAAILWACAILIFMFAAGLDRMREADA